MSSLLRPIFTSALVLALLQPAASFAQAQHPNYAISILQQTTNELNLKVMYFIGTRDFRSLETAVKDAKDVNVPDTKGVSPIHYAAAMGSAVATKIMVDRGANIMALTFGKWSPLHYAAFGGHLETVQFLVSKGAVIDAQDSGGETPLFYAIEGGHLRVVEWLIKQKANVNIVNYQDISPLELAKEMGLQPIIDLLIKAGASDD